MKVTSQRLQAGVLGALIIGTLSVLGWVVLTHSGSTDPFMPHSHCYLMIRELILLHGVSDLLIGASYVGISATLTYLVLRARREIPFHWMMLAFATFIVACGATHFMEVWTLTSPHPQYWLSAEVKITTALASVATAFLLPPLIPKILRLLQEARISGHRKEELERTNNELTLLYKRLSELDQLKTNFFANISHELRTPLALILGPTEKLIEVNGPEHESARDLNLIRRNTLLLQKHVDDLLDASKLEAGKMKVAYKRFNAAALVRIVSDFFTSSNIRPVNLVVHAPASIVVEADPDKVQRILFNLLSNAFKFTPRGEKVEVDAAVQNGELVIRVNDSGPGVSPENRERIFERFQQGSQDDSKGGTGLGLTIAREFTELHGGTLTVADSPSGGASFVLKLPLKGPAEADGTISSPVLEEADLDIEGVARTLRGGLVQITEAPQMATGQPGDASHGDRSRPLVLIVEDNPEMAQMTASSLSDGYRIEIAPNGNEAWRMIDESTPDLVLTDLMMPGMSGAELLSKIRSRPELLGLPVILLTAKADEELKVTLLKEGAQDYLTKPIAVQELRARVKNQLQMKQARDTLQRALAKQDVNIGQLAEELSQRAQDLEKAKVVAESANQAKDQFLAVLSHELRTPLTPVLALATELESRSDVSPWEYRQAVSVIRRNIELESRLIDDLLDLTRISRGKLQLRMDAVDVHEVLRDTVNMCGSRLADERAKVELRLEAASHSVTGDSTRLLQIFWNLLINALKFTPKEGVVTISTRNEADQILIAFNDTGIGIAPDILTRIFEPFEQGEQSAIGRRTGGLGIGLAVVKGLIEAHGASITVTSDGVGAGATFLVRMKAHAPEAAKPAAGSREVQTGSANLRVLLLEDHEDTRATMVRLLRRWGYSVTEARTIAEARSLFQAETFDVLLSDLGLPDGHGADFMTSVRHTGIYAVAISGFGMEEDLRRTQEAGFRDHLTKPVAADVLRAALARAGEEATGQNSGTAS